MSLDLYAWAKQYISHKDVITRNILEIKDTGEIVYKDGSRGSILFDFQPKYDATLKKIYIILPSANQSIDAIVQHWDVLKECKNLTIICTHQGEKTWLLTPYVHNRISDGDLKSGLLSLQKNSA